VPKERLDSWKDIAEYLERSLRTVQRWHAYHGLPVRHFRGTKGSVFAYTDEIDRWLISLSEETRVTPMDEREAIELRKKKSQELTASATQMWEARSEGNLQTISGLYRKAIDEDVSNPAALTGLANTMIFGAVNGVLDGSVAYLRAQEALRRLPAAAAESPEARCATAWLSMLYERNWRQAQAGFDQVLSRQPWSSFALSGRSLLYVVEGNLQQAGKCAWEAWKGSPLACSLGTLMCWVNYLAGDLEQALDLAVQVRAFGGCGTMTAAIEACCLLQVGTIAAQLKRLESIVGAYPESQLLQGLLGYAYVMTGKAGKAEEMLRDLENLSELKKKNHGYALALILLAMGDKQEAVKWLEASYEEGTVWSLAYRFDPLLVTLRDEPRFEVLARKSLPTVENGFPPKRPQLPANSVNVSIFGRV
jgi:tetratricopeptide (TPR) repeat protein